MVPIAADVNAITMRSKPKAYTCQHSSSSKCMYTAYFKTLNSRCSNSLFIAARLLLLTDLQLRPLKIQTVRICQQASKQKHWLQHLQVYLCRHQQCGVSSLLLLQHSSKSRLNLAYVHIVAAWHVSDKHYNNNRNSTVSSAVAQMPSAACHAAQQQQSQMLHHSADQVSSHPTTHVARKLSSYAGRNTV